jgi:hypothetical protein
MPSILGTWKLVDATARDAAGTAHPSPYGGKAMGRLTFTADGRMMSVVCDGRPELPAGVWTVVGKEFPHPVGHHNVMNVFPHRPRFVHRS